MKVRCVQNLDKHPELTIGNDYDVIDEHRTGIRIINDRGYSVVYDHEHFKDVRAIKEQKISNETTVS